MLTCGPAFYPKSLEGLCNESVKPTNLRGGSAKEEESEEESEGFPGFCSAEFGIARLGSQKHR